MEPHKKRAQKIIRGIVRHGDGRGKPLGFPTANMRLHQPIPEGIYCAYATIDKRRYSAITFIGAAKTFHKTKRQAETYILDFDKNIYGKWLRVMLLKKLRGNKKFHSVQALIRAMRLDEKQARIFFSQRHITHQK
ncbi:MAG: riboflavin kinase [Candidatus Kerfeldbacteria bacterium]|nr:riboflavin kinase [Candidatus Kerfeldbacteria bacterium]